MVSKLWSCGLTQDDHGLLGGEFEAADVWQASAYAPAAVEVDGVGHPVAPHTCVAARGGGREAVVALLRVAE